jgi:hypothetical protein
MGLNKLIGIMVIPFEVVDHQDLWFNVPYISAKATHDDLPNILRKKERKKERNSNNRPNKSYLPFFWFLQYHPEELPLGG